MAVFLVYMQCKRLSVDKAKVITIKFLTGNGYVWETKIRSVFRIII